MQHAVSYEICRTDSYMQRVILAVILVGINFGGYIFPEYDLYLGAANVVLIAAALWMVAVSKEKSE